MSLLATAESNRIRSSKADLHGYFATRCATVRLHLVLVFFLFFAPSYRDHPRFVRVNAYCLRLTDDGASTRLLSTVNSEKPGIPSPRSTQRCTVSVLLVVFDRRRHGVCSVRPFQIVTGRYLSPARSKVSASCHALLGGAVKNSRDCES
jgi:hypothetical protein